MDNGKYPMNSIRSNESVDDESVSWVTSQKSMENKIKPVEDK